MALNTLLSFTILTAVTLLSATESHAQTSDSSSAGKAKATVGELSKKPKQNRIVIEPKKEIPDNKGPKMGKSYYSIYYSGFCKKDGILPSY